MAKNSTSTDELGKAHAPSPAPVKKISAAEQLRAFEDEKLGADVTRWDGKVERGHGSLHARMSDADKARHAELEKAAETDA